MTVILCVCTGNLCRSPMAEGLLRERLAQERPGSHHTVSSAGTWALDGQPASAHAVSVMAERGIDISGHVARTTSGDDVAEADLILVMSNEHAQVIRNSWPQYDWKVHRISRMAGKRENVRDPYGGTIEEYRICADTISRYIERGIARILELA